MKKYYTNGINEIRIDSSQDSVPNGYYPGRLNSNYGSKGFFWINNSKIELTISKETPIPEGFIKGRLPRTTSTISKHRETLIRNKFHHYTDGINDILVKEGDTIPSGYHLGRPNMSSEQKTKLSNSHKGLHHSEDTKIKISLNSNNNRNKAKQTCLQKYGVEYPSQVSEIRDRGIQTKKQNNTFNTSKPETLLYNSLIEQYGKENVVRNYKDKRYPFYCDFYIKSKDLFIELNAHWTHGGKPFDENDEQCLLQLFQWQEKAKTSQFYKNAIETWTIRDVKKAQIAKENNLNYKVIYS